MLCVIIFTPRPFRSRENSSRYVYTEQVATWAPELAQTFYRKEPLASAGNTYSIQEKYFTRFLETFRVQGTLKEINIFLKETE